MCCRQYVRNERGTDLKVSATLREAKTSLKVSSIPEVGQRVDSAGREIYAVPKGDTSLSLGAVNFIYIDRRDKDGLS
jgi:hypothetical protein